MGADPVAVGGIREAPLEFREVVLGARVLDVREVSRRQTYMVFT